MAEKHQHTSSRVIQLHKWQLSVNVRRVHNKCELHTLSNLLMHCTYHLQTVRADTKGHMLCVKCIMYLVGASVSEPHTSDKC